MLTGFGLINSQCYADSTEKKANRKKSIDFIKKHGTKPFVKELYPNLFNEAYLKQNRKVVNAMIAKAEKYTLEAVAAATAAMMNREDKSGVLKNSKVPVLLLGGKDDTAAPLDAQLKQAPLPSVSHVYIFGQCKHMSLYEKKKETFTAVKNFLS
jgi:pimeloyl-ACP methyl ester carboxylesterase